MSSKQQFQRDGYIWTLIGKCTISDQLILKKRDSNDMICLSISSFQTAENALVGNSFARLKEDVFESVPLLQKFEFIHDTASDERTLYRLTLHDYLSIWKNEAKYEVFSCTEYNRPVFIFDIKLEPVKLD